MYRDNAFHNFDHASHVVTSVIKHMNRIIAPTDVNNDQHGDKPQLSKAVTAASLHDQTYGITSDPLTQFACVYSALIHDLDHPGVMNPQLIQADAQMAAMYKERSVAEQNSFDIGKFLRSKAIKPRYTLLNVTLIEIAGF
jgi:3'5'-cyclic nucleotide phosphodiesterase